MPVIIEWNYVDGSKEIEQLSAEIWRHNEAEVKKTFMKSKEVASVIIDPNQSLADVNMENNVFPKVPSDDRFEKAKKNK